jgi:acetyl-CoA C-acetyltransferase
LIYLASGVGFWFLKKEGEMSIRDRVAIVGVGATKFGENFEMTYQDMALEAVYEAYQDAALDTKDMEAAWLGPPA